MHDNRTVLENRIRREFHERIRPAEVIARRPLEVGAWELPGEPLPYAEALAQAVFEPLPPGTAWGRPWGTTWFHVAGEVPDDLPAGLHEVEVELGFTGSGPGFQAEGAVVLDGRILCGLHPRRRRVALERLRVGDGVDFHVEAASNADFSISFSPNPLGSAVTAADPAYRDAAPLYRFGGASIVVLDPEVVALAREFRLLDQMMRTRRLDDPLRLQVQRMFQRALDALDLVDVAGTAAAARAELAPGFAQGRADTSHHVSAIGHAHIDTAWLWPMRETRRKCARTFANATFLMQDRPDFRFACSQAVQYAWIEEEHPELFARIRGAVERGQWVPVGGMWVEADMNLPSGESLARQLVHGQRWFESRFGRRCTEIWIPDVFGYPGSLPQVFAGGGCTRFVTQKLSWNKQNRFPHNTFWWEGIDGTRVLTHFPPVDTYNAEIVPHEVAHSVANFRDHYWSSESLMPFGHGDGGGGPTAEMLHRMDLLDGAPGMPSITERAPAEFFDLIEAEAARGDTPVWRGELYFEMHRGTFTSQIETKVGNRRCEDLLAEAELWLATAGDDSRAAELDALWKTVLVNQFHDIIPGSSIGWVHADAEADHAAVAAACTALIDSALGTLAPTGPSVANPTQRPRDEVVCSDVDPMGDGPVQRLHDGRAAFRTRVGGFGVAAAEAVTADQPVTVSTTPTSTATPAATTLTNGLVELAVDATGDLRSLRDLRVDRELLPAGAVGAQLTLAPDHPVEFDAWDLEQWTASLAHPLGPATSVDVLDAGPLVASVRVSRPCGRASHVTQTFVLRAGSARVDVEIEVDWQEVEHLLAIEFPLDVRADTAACEIQFGLERRPTHVNTSWDAAKFEVCAHRFVDLSEPHFGVAVLNDGRWGHAVQHGGIRVSLLRSARYPDPAADRGHHRCTLALLPHGPGLAEVLAEADALNRPLRLRRGPSTAGSPMPTAHAPVVTVEDPRVQVSAVKLADDGSGDLVVRVWEATGDRVRTGIATRGPAGSVTRCNFLEEPDGEPLALDAGRAVLELRPFEIATLRFGSRP